MVPAWFIFYSLNRFAGMKEVIKNTFQKPFQLNELGGF